MGEDINPKGRTNLENYTYGQIRSWRNLENLFRLWLCSLPPLPTSQGYTVTLGITPVSGNPAINLYPACESDGGIGYLTDTNVAAEQVSAACVPGVLNSYGRPWPRSTAGKVTRCRWTVTAMLSVTAKFPARTTCLREPGHRRGAVDADGFARR